MNRTEFLRSSRCRRIMGKTTIDVITGRQIKLASFQTLTVQEVEQEIPYLHDLLGEGPRTHLAEETYFAW
jgi:hypothetical protein